MNTNKTTESTDEQNKEKATENLDSDVLKNYAEIENVVKTSLKP